MLLVLLLLACIVIIGVWREYPVAMTAYTYFFGALFLGAGSLYYIFTGQADQFLIPQHVSTPVYTVMWLSQIFCLGSRKLPLH